MTAVEWLETEIDKIWEGDIMYMEMPRSIYYKLIEQAKQMEKDELKKFFNAGFVVQEWDKRKVDLAEQYYNERYGKQ